MTIVYFDCLDSKRTRRSEEENTLGEVDQSHRFDATAAAQYPLLQKRSDRSESRLGKQGILVNFIDFFLLESEINPERYFESIQILSPGALSSWSPTQSIS